MSFEPEVESENEYEGVPEIAVVGMAGRFPAADDLDAFWRSLRDGVECIRTSTPDELRASGYFDEQVLADPAFVPRFGALNEVESFDAAFFGYNPREAEAMEPAHRLFLECCWEALENGGVDPARAEGNVGVFGGAGTPYYTEEHVRRNAAVMAAIGEFQINVGSGKDFLATRAAYKLDLRGPAISVQTGCSTSLVAVHVAAQALLHGECDLALAGGANVVVPNGGGYMYSPDGISSPDGRCRAFDADAAGTLSGNGVGVVLLKRLADAVRDGDRIRAVIKGSAVNNDGALKVAFTAPSVEGQAAVIREALEMADVDPSTIRYVEAHGSGTKMGDPIEIAALTQAYRGWTDRRNYAAVGSVKTAIGHLDAAAGIAGFIKTVLALEAKELPPTLHFRRPNPSIDFASSPFYVSAQREAWEAGDEPRRAGVSSFGIGGTNAHVVLEEAPETRPSQARRATQLLVLSARTPTALDAATERLSAHLAAHPEQPLHDVAHTLQIGRREFPFRRTLVVRAGEDASALLAAKHPERVWTAAVEDGHRSVAFLFPGVGDQYPQMARGLYDSEPAFRAEVDRCAAILQPLLGLDIRTVLFPGEAPVEAAPNAGIDLKAMLGKADSADPNAERLNRTELAQPAVFVVEYALAKLWMSWGIAPQAVIGHSLGEYAAACVAGIFSLDDALALVAERARMIGALPGGSMLAVSVSAERAAEFLVEGTAIATVNAPELCVVAGPVDAVDAVQRRLADAGITARKLAATHAFHSPMMDPVVGPVAELVGRMRLSAPKIPMASNVTGTWITPAEATDPRYWARHTRETVRFDRGVAELLRAPGRVLIEVGPGQTLSTFVRQRGDAGDVAVIPSIRYPYDRTPDAAFLLGALGRLWLAGVTPDWAGFHAGERLNRVPLPTYAWDRQRYWVERLADDEAERKPRGGRKNDPADWLYVPSWQGTAAPRPSFGEGDVLVFADDSALSAGAVDALRGFGRTPVVVRAGDVFAQGADGFTVRPASREDHRKLVDALADAGGVPTTILHLWSVAEAPARGTVGVLVLADALHRGRADAALVTVTSGAADAGSGDGVDAAKAAIFGAAAVLRVEASGVAPRVVDVAPPRSDAEARALGARVAAEALAGEEREVALRGRHRWTRAFRAVRPAPVAAPVLREGGVYLFIGGLRGRSERLAEHAIRRYGARIVLIDPTLPHRGGWDPVVRARLPEDPLRRQIERIRALEAEGAEILNIQVLPNEPEQVASALAQIDAQLGALHGVVFAPLVYDEGEREGIGEVRVAKWERRMMHLLGELNGVHPALADRALDFVVVESSLTPELGGIGLIDVAAMHAVVNAFTASATADDARPWTAAAWDRWFLEDEVPEGYGMAEAESVAAFEHLLTLAGEPVVLLSTGDVEARQSGRGESSPGAAVGSYARPQLATEYHAPQTDVEEVVARMWEELLGISPIGIHDDFFALGGHSLLATQIISRCRDSFGLDLPLKAIFEAPTISRFAVLVEDAIVAEIDQLTDEEALELAGV
jgi:acyl transferase domain-containing protein